MPRKSTLTKKPRTPAALLADRVNLAMKKNVVTMASDQRFRLERVPTGSLVIDRLTGGGFARGRHSLLYGDFMAGKSLILYMTMALAQQRGETCALVDGEKVFNAEWFEILGGSPDELVMFQPEEQQFSANEIGNVLRLLIDKSDDMDPASIIGIDSVASLVPNEEIDYDMDSGKDVRTASQARLMSLLLRVLTSQNDGTTFLWTNQWRDKISSIPGLRSTPGGRSLGFYASTMVEMMKGDKETVPHSVPYKGKMVERKMVEGQWVNCTLTKEKTGGRPFDSLSFFLNYETKQIDRAREIIDLGMRIGVIERTGDYYSLATPDGNTARLHGVKRTVNRINDDEELQDFLVTCIEEASVSG